MVEGLKILIIDDEKPTLMMFRLFLEAYGHEVLTAENGEEGLRITAAERPQVVFTDIKMPGLDGLRVLRRIREEVPGTPVVVITGHGNRDLEAEARALGALDFIHKPIGKEALDRALEKAVEEVEAQ